MVEPLTQRKPRIRFTVNDYMTAPPGKRYQLLDGEMVPMDSPADSTSGQQSLLPESESMTRPKIKFTVNDYMTAPEDKRYQLLDGEMILAPAPTTRHQAISIRLATALFQFVSQNNLGQVWTAPYDVVLSDYDVAQPDILFVSNQRAHLVTPANIQGAPDLVVEVLSPGTQQYDRGYKRSLYARHGVREYWLVDPAAETVEVQAESDEGLTPVAAYGRGEILISPLLPGLSIGLAGVFSGR